MKYRILLFLVLQSAPFLAQEQAPKELQTYLDNLEKEYKTHKDSVTTYSTSWYTSMNTMLSQIADFGESELEKIKKELAPIQKKIPIEVQKADTALDDTYSKHKKEMDEIVNKVNQKKLGIKNAATSMNRPFLIAKREMYVALEPLTILDGDLKKVDREVMALVTSSQEKKKKAAEKRMRAFYANLNTILPKLKIAQVATRGTYAAYLATRKIDANSIIEVTQNYISLIDEFDAAYKKNNVEVSFDSKGNYVAVVLRNLINFYLGDIGITLRVAKRLNAQLTLRKESKLAYYAYFYDLAQRIQGSGKGEALVVAKGYNGQIASLAQQYFKDQEKTVTNYFGQAKAVMSIDAFGNALWNIGINETDPTDTVLTYAETIYKEIIASAPFFDQDQAQNAANQANEYMAGIYLNVAQSSLKKMDPKKDTSALLDTTIKAYQKASDYFKQAGDQTNAQQYENLQNSLLEGKTNRGFAQTAENDGNLSRAASLYGRAFQAFSVGGDSVDAANAEEKMNEVNAKANVQEAQEKLKDFLAKNKLQLQEYMAAMSSPVNNQTPALATYTDLLSEMSDVCKKAVEDYKSAIASLEALEKPVASLEKAVVVLDSLYRGLEYLNTGDAQAVLGTEENLEMAEYTHYPLALLYARKADQTYVKELAENVVIFPSQLVSESLDASLMKNQAWDVELLFNRHIAKKYMEIADTVQDKTLAVHYLAVADGTRLVFLPQAVEAVLSSSLETIMSDSHTFSILLQNAEEKLTTALALTAKDWQQTSKEEGLYLSTADAVWQDVVKRLATLFRFGKDITTAQEKLLNAIAAYAKSYQADVPKEFYPSVGAAIIYFRQYVVYVVGNESANAGNALQTVQGQIKTFFELAKTLQKNIENPDLLATASVNQAKIVEWKNRFEQAVDRQNAIIAQLAPKIDPTSLQHLSITIDDKTGDVVCSMKSGQTIFETITISNPELKLAQIYQKLGVNYDKMADYKNAYYSYYYARTHYNNAGRIDLASQVDELYKKAYTRSIYHAYLELVVPNKTYQHDIKMEKIAQISVPHHYELYNSVVPLKTKEYEIPLPANLAALAQDTTAQAAQQIQDLLFLYAYLIFLEKKLIDNGIDPKKVITDDVPPQLRSLDEIAQNFSKDELPLVVSIVESASYYQKKLQERVKGKRSTLHLLESRGELILAISYDPVLASTPFNNNQYMTQKPYKSYYPADTYYSAIRALANPNVAEVSIFGHSFVSGNEKDVYNAALDDLGSSSLSAAGAYQRRIDFMVNGGNLDDVDPTIGYDEMATLTGAQKRIAALKKIKKDDFSVKITDYQQPLDIMKSYAKGVIDSYYNEAYGYYSEKGGAILENINKALSSSYLSVGDYLQLFLVGNPLSGDYFYGRGTSYGGLIVDIQNFYQLTFAYDQKLLDQAEQKIATMYENAGDLVTDKLKNYFGSLPYYKFAVSAYHVMKSPDAKKFAQTGAKLLDVYFKGSLEQLLRFRQAMVKPIPLAGGTTIALEDLIDQSKQVDVSMTDTQRAVANMLHDTLLDATIYFGDASGWGSIFAYPKGKPQDENGKDPVNKAARELLNTYTKDHNISFDIHDIKKAQDLDQNKQSEDIKDKFDNTSLIATIKRDDFEKVMQGAMDSFKSKVLQATNDQDRLIGFAAIEQLTNTIYFALGKLYIHYYLSGLVPSEQYIQWESAISAEKQNIVAPAEQWLGSE